MKKSDQLKHIVLGSGLLLGASMSPAVSLGRLQGVAWVGQTLQVTSQFQLAADEDANPACVDAEVYYGDNRVPSQQVQVQVEAGTTAQDFQIKLRSAAVIDEPVVTVYLRAGCTQKVSRRHVLLAELPTDQALNDLRVNASAALAPLPAPAVLPAAPLPAAPVSRSTSAVAGQGGKSVPARKRVDAPKPDAVLPAPVQKATPALTGQRAATAPAPANGPRLKLDFNDAAPAQLALKPSGSLASVPLDNDPRRAEAQTAWKALNPDASEALSAEAAARKSLEAELRQLQSAVRAIQNTNKDLNERLQSAQSERYSNGLVYGLAGLLLLSLGLLIKTWRASGLRSAQDWWRGDSVHAALEPDEPAHAVTASVSLPGALPMASMGAMPVAAPAPELPRSEQPVPTLHELGLPSGGREVNAEELFDIQQQADFFKSLGQHEQAIALLESHIQESNETSPLVYLDLLAIYHGLQRGEDYARLRADFNRVFNAKVPPIEAFETSGEGLESYERALSRVESLWNTPKVLEVLEESVFRRPSHGEDRPFDLEAYRELLMLHGIAKEVLGSPAPVDAGHHAPVFDDDEWGGSAHGQFSHTSIQPLQAFRGEYGDVPDQPGQIGYGRWALDIDIGDAAAPMPVAPPAGASLAPVVTPVLAQMPDSLDDAFEVVHAGAESMPMLDFDLGEEITLTAHNVVVPDSDEPLA